MTSTEPSRPSRSPTRTGRVRCCCACPPIAAKASTPWWKRPTAPAGGPILPWPEGAAAERRYLGTLERDVRALLAEGATIAETVGAAAREESGAWTLFDEHNPRNATEAYTELEWE